MGGPEALHFQPGSKNQMTIKVEGTQLKMPLSIICGEREGPTVLISTGLHGGEYPGILAMVELMRDLAPEEVSGRILALHPVNTQAFRARVSLILPEDGVNLNRAFPGNPHGSASEKAAWRITELQDLADFYLDLHSGDLFEDLTPYAYYPGDAAPEILEASRRAAGVLHVPYLTPARHPGGAICSAAQRGTPALLLERGGAGACGREEVALYKRDVINVLKYLGVLHGDPDRPLTPPREIPELTYLESKHSALWQAAEIELGDKVRAGQELGRLFDYFGDTLEVCRAERDGVLLYRLRSLSANAGDILAAF